MKLKYLLSAAVVVAAATAGSLSAIDGEFSAIKDTTVLKMRATHYKKEFTRLNSAPRHVPAPAKLTAASDLYMLITDDMDGYINHVKPIVVTIFNDVLDTMVMNKNSLIAIAAGGSIGDGGAGDAAVAAYEAAAAAAAAAGGLIGDGGVGDAAIAAAAGGLIGDGGAGDAAVAAAAVAHASAVRAVDPIFDAVTATGVGGAGLPASVNRGDVKAAFANLVNTFDHATLGNPALLVDSTTDEVNACKGRVNAAILATISGWIDQVVPGLPATNVFAAGHALPSNSKGDVMNFLAEYLEKINK